jgi:cation transport ATPase
VQYCCRRACCFRSPTGARLTSPAAPSSVYKVNDRSQKLEKAASKAIQDGEGVRHGEKLQLEIRGMDCVDCVPKVGRALAQLPTVTSVNVDYFSGVAELQHDPETIASAAIANYVSRATGFGIKVLTSDPASSNSSAAIIILPISFSTVPPREAFDGLEVRYGSKPRIIEILVPTYIDSPHRPREIMERLKLFGAVLVPADFEGRQDRVTRDLIVVAVRTISCAILSIPVLVLAWADLPHRPTLYGGISVGLTTLIQGLAFPLISSAFRSIVYLRQVDMSVLVCISTLTAYVFSVVSYAFQVADKPFASPFFETTALLVTLIFLGRTISAITRRSTGSALRELQRLQPANILLLPSVEKTSSEPQELDSRLLHYGDIIRILPETRIATDGLVIRGSSDADESSVTGESGVVSKQPGSRVIAGTLNLGGTLDVQVTKLIHENSLARISALVRQARASRSPTQDLSDKFSAVILPAAAISAGIAFLVWVMVGLYVRDDTATDATVNALTYAIAILVVSCPCAIGLAVSLLAPSQYFIFTPFLWASVCRCLPSLLWLSALEYMKAYSFVLRMHYRQCITSMSWHLTRRALLLKAILRWNVLRS